METINQNDENKDTVKKVEQIENAIKTNEKELEQIRKDCKHPAETIIIKNCSNGVGASEFRKVCGVCKQIVGYPTPDEVRSEVEGPRN